MKALSSSTTVIIKLILFKISNKCAGQMCWLSISYANATDLQEGVHNTIFYTETIYVDTILVQLTFLFCEFFLTAYLLMTITKNLKISIKLRSGSSLVQTIMFEQWVMTLGGDWGEGRGMKRRRKRKYRGQSKKVEKGEESAQGAKNKVRKDT